MVSSSLDRRKARLISSAATGTRIGPLVHAYYRHVAPEDVVDRSEADLYGAVSSQLRLAEHRPQGTARVRVFTPTQANDGWSADGHSVVEVVTDDMPFLVDSITMEIGRQQHDIHLVVHPQVEVVRDVAGELHAALPIEDGAAETDTQMLSSVPALVAGAADASRESWMHVEISRLADQGDVAAITEGVERVLRDVRESVEDWDRMHAQVDDIVRGLADDPPPLPADEVKQGRELLAWLADAHFTFLGYREYRLVRGDDGGDYLRAVPGTGFGILRADPPMDSDGVRLPDAVAAHARDKTLLVLAKANSRSTVHRPAYLDYVGVKVFEGDEVVGERRFLGLFSSGAYTESLTRIPVLREKAAEVLRRVGFDASSHAGKALLDTLENYPRDELFHTPVDQLAPMAEEVMYTRERRQLRVFVRRDAYGRYFSVLVYLPRDRYNTSVRERFAEILKQQLGGDTVEFNVRLNESLTARVHFVVRPPSGQMVAEVDADDLERRLTEASRSWREDFATAVTAAYGEDRSSDLIRTYADSFPEAYKEDFSPRIAASDLGRIERLAAEATDGVAAAEPIDLSVDGRTDVGRGEARLKLYKIGEPISLSRVLPMLSSMGVEVVDERPYELEGLRQRSHVYEFGLRYGDELPSDSAQLFDEALRAIWDGRNEIDGFNALVLSAGLTWRQATVLRAYAKYMRQCGTPFTQESIEATLGANVEITRLLVDLFEARFDPDVEDTDRDSRVDALVEQVTRALDEVASLDHDRILRSYLTHVGATVRTNHFQESTRGHPHLYLSLKLEPAQIPDLPQPRPKFEIFVYSPRVEGVHLRFGAVARGGLRWSDRRDDFRTEVLGLVKAQMVKNTVIVPVGAKGGFYCRQLPDVADREAWLAEGVACYRTFVSGLLDITDNLVEGVTVSPLRVVRHDGDDSYLVVAADKGTATFSDIANGVAQAYGFWLGDAFASGGSVGYDHKAMGITARGAWVSVRRHFRELGVDCQTEDVTVVGIGDMSGDVFGNGMLCSEHIRLVAAFDHRDIFLDPDPDPAASYAERRRMFALPRSSWQDYDTSLISAGGGVHSRALKRVPITAEVRRVLGLDHEVDHLTPAELMRAILLAPADLLWNGGIGTYVKGAGESHAEAGDKANDPIRVDGAELRVRCVGEGGNLGLTQQGRLEYAQSGGRDRSGGRINTDFIDNSAGVDTSDHEVNIKILLDGVVATADLTEDQRNTLLASMTDEVASLVLRHNYEQNLALANEAADAVGLLFVHEEWMRRLEKSGVLSREVEGLPSPRQVRARLDAGQGLTGPELSVLLAWTKIVLSNELLDSDLPDDPYLLADLFGYFPVPMQQDYHARMKSHPLRREIIVTQVVGDLVNGAGITFWPRLAGETGASAAELTRANFVAREIFGSQALRVEISGYDNVLPADLQTRMRLDMRTLVERASRWLVTNRRPPLDSEGLVDFFSVTVQQVMSRLPDLMCGRELTAYVDRRDSLLDAGVPKELAEKVAVLPPAYGVLGLVEVARAIEVDPEVAARVHFVLGERLGLPVLLARIISLPRRDRWQTMARATLRDDLYAVHAQLTQQVLTTTSAGEAAAARIATWEESEAGVVERATATLEEICSDDQADLARMSVGLRVVRSLLA